jgi:hypothetical protein
MSIRHSAAERWEARLRELFIELDRVLEQDFAGRLPLPPNRPAPGQTADPESDGLFNIGAAFSPGYGSRHGPGYVVDIQIRSIAPIPTELRERIEHRVVEWLRRRLPEQFPNAQLEVVRDGPVWKIVGDLSLGKT